MVSVNPGYTGTNLNNFAGTRNPKDSVRIVVQHAPERTGESAGFYYNEGLLAMVDISFDLMG
jgi:hypothetical protein